jgi:hypothetical protein
MNSCVTYERSKIIPIQPTSPTNKKEHNFDMEYSLVQNLFDPSKSSPPNEFLLKLKLRMSLYDTFTKEDNRMIE